MFSAQCSVLSAQCSVPNARVAARAARHNAHGAAVTTTFVHRPSLALHPMRLVSDVFHLTSDAGTRLRGPWLAKQPGDWIATGMAQ